MRCSYLTPRRRVTEAKSGAVIRFELSREVSFGLPLRGGVCEHAHYALGLPAVVSGVRMWAVVGRTYLMGRALK